MRLKISRPKDQRLFWTISSFRDLYCLADSLEDHGCARNVDGTEVNSGIGGSSSAVSMTLSHSSKARAWTQTSSAIYEIEPTEERWES